MKKILFIFLLLAFKASAQTPFPLYVPNSITRDSIKHTVNVGGAPRTVYNLDLTKGKVDSSNTITINGSAKTLGSNPSFTISGSGTASKQIWVNLADYADSTGATDATAGINNAISATPDGGTLYIGKGYFKTSGGHTINKRINIIGSGAGYFDWRNPGNGIKFFAGSSVISLMSTTATLFTYSGESGVIANVDFRVDSTLSPSTAVGLNLTGGSGIQLVNNSFYQFDIGVHFVNGGEWAIDRCFFEGNKSYGLTIENQRYGDEGDATISNSWFYAKNGSTGQNGINYLSGGGLKISNTKFNGPLGTCINAALNITTSILMVSNSSFENFRNYGIKVDAPTIFQFPVIVGNQFSPYSTITGNCIYINGTTNAVKDVLISGNIFKDISSNANPAILLNTVTGYYVGGNRFSGWANTLSVPNSTSGEVPFQQIDTGSSSKGYMPTKVFGNEITNIPANLYGIAVAKAGVDYLMMGVNKNTATGSIPANSTYISTFGSGNLSLGRGNGAGLPSTNDLNISSSGNVTATVGLNVGTGTASTTAAFQVPAHFSNKNNAEFGTMGFQSFAVNNGFFSDNLYYNAAFKYRAAGLGILSYFLNGDYQIQTAPTGAAGATATMTQRFKVSNTGLVSIGSQTATSTLDVTTGSLALAYTAKVAAYTATSTDHTIDCNGTFTVTLPAATSITGRVYVIANTGAGAITVSSASTVTATTVAAGTSNQYQSTGTAWIKIN